jgi:hypothetical protein
MFGLGINKLGASRSQAIAEPETLLFANDEEGTFLDFTTTQVYADTAGTDPAEVGEGIALTLDKSQGGGVARRNLLTYTEEFDNAAWLKLNSGTGLAPVLTPDFAEAPDGTMTAWRLQLDIDGGSASADQSNIRQGFTAVAPVRSCYMKLNSGSNTTIALNLSTASANVVVTNEWQRLSSSVVGTPTIHDIGLRGNIATSKVADILIWHPQVEEASLTPYQKITTGINGEWTPGTHSTQATSTARPIFRLTSGVYNAEFDLTDDILPITLPTITGGTVALVGTSGIWIEDDWDFTAGTLNIGPTTIAGLPAGILSVVGDLCAVIINDRAWTAAERAGVVAWGKARGAPGVFEWGDELLTNPGGPFVDTSDFTYSVNATVTVDAGRLAITRSGDPSISNIWSQNTAITPGFYRAILDIDEYTAGGGFVSEPASNFTTIGVSGVAVRYLTVTSTSPPQRVTYRQAGSPPYTTDVKFNSLSFRKLELIP